jgi:hypothetical protein
VKAVNLIPREERRGGPGAPARSGGAVYILLGALGILVVAVVAYVLTNNSITDKKAELAKVTSQATAAEAQAAALRPFREFAALKQTRASTVSSLAASRFDWERVMRQLAIVLPSNVWLTSVVGTVAPGVAFSSGGGGGGGTGGGRLLRGAGGCRGLLGAGGGGGAPGRTGAGKPSSVFCRGADGGGTGPRALGSGAGAAPLGLDFFAASPSNTSRSELALSLIDAALSASLL